MTSKKDSQSDSILIIAAEASSCMYAKKFIKQWQQLFPQDSFYGVGDREMEEMGVECLGYAEDMAVVGVFEVMKHWSTISKTFKAIKTENLKRNPKFAILLDYPGFNLRMAKVLKKQDIPVVYYISPQLWAWKKGRVNQVQKFIEHMLVVFPFEVEFYKEYQVEAQFVGHPLVEVVEDEIAKVDNSNKEELVLGLMPGSRLSEIEFNLPAQLAAAEMLQKDFPQLKVKVLLAPTLKEEDIQEPLQVSDLKVECLKQAPTQMILDCDYILTASGTATLQVALCEKPMVVMYRMNGLTAFMAKKLVNTVDYFCIVNLIAKKEIVPEFFQEEASPENLYKTLKKLVGDSVYRENMLTEIKAVKKDLGAGGATENVVNFLKQKYKTQ